MNIGAVFEISLRATVAMTAAKKHTSVIVGQNYSGSRKIPIVTVISSKRTNMMADIKPRATLG